MMGNASELNETIVSRQYGFSRIRNTKSKGTGT